MLHQQIVVFRRQNKLCDSGMAWRQTSAQAYWMEESICTSTWGATRPFVLLIPKASVASVLFNLFFTNPQKGQGREKWQVKLKLLRALNSLADSVASACFCVCVCVFVWESTTFHHNPPPHTHTHTPPFAPWAYVTVEAEEWPYVRRCVQTAGDYTAAIISVWTSFSSSSFRYTQSQEERTHSHTRTHTHTHTALHTHLILRAH